MRKIFKRGIPMPNIIKVALLALFIMISPILHAEVTVSPVMSVDATQQIFAVGPGKYVIVSLPGKGSPDDSYKLTINVNNAIYKDITANLVDEDNLRLFKNGSSYKGIGYRKAIAPFVIQGSTLTPGAHYLILDNTFAALITKKVSVTIEARFSLNQAERQQIERMFSNMYAALKKTLIFPDFNIHVEPCGEVNASSDSFGNGDVRYCTEMISHLARTKNQGAFTAIFLHEVGHSLLGLWGIPGNNNEDIADEFSTYMLMSSGPSGYALLDRSLEFWQNRDSSREVQMMLEKGDRHSLSIQRLRNIKENMQMGEAFIKRWNKLLYQHATSEALAKTIKNPMYGDDAELAQSILAQRNKLVN
jgi:hypothetical protein